MGFYKGGMDFTTYLIKDMGMGQNLRPVCFSMNLIHIHISTIFLQVLLYEHVGNMQDY
jgi:hypothetical protein